MELKREGTQLFIRLDPDDLARLATTSYCLERGLGPEGEHPDQYTVVKLVNNRAMKGPEAYYDGKNFSVLLPWLSLPAVAVGVKTQKGRRYYDRKLTTLVELRAEPPS